MSNPLAIPDELGVYLGRTIDNDRANLILQLAHDRLEMYATPVPVLAKGIELAVAARSKFVRREVELKGYEGSSIAWAISFEALQEMLRG